MDNRYFARVSIPDGTPEVLFRMDIDNTAKTLDCFMWDTAAAAWVEYQRFMEYLVFGDPRYDEITEQAARNFMPDAFLRK